MAAAMVTTRATASTCWRPCRCGRKSTVPAMCQALHDAGRGPAAFAAVRQPGLADWRLQLFPGAGSGARIWPGARRGHGTRVDRRASDAGGGALGSAAVLAFDAGVRSAGLVRRAALE